MVLRLGDLALQKYTELIEKLVFINEPEIRRKTSKTTVQKICCNFGAVKGLEAIILSGIYSHSEGVSHWETMKNILESSLQYCEVVKQKYCSLEKENTNSLKESAVTSEEQVQLEEFTLEVINTRNGTILSVPNLEHGHVINRFISHMLAGENETVTPFKMTLMPHSGSITKEACAFVDSNVKEIPNNDRYSAIASLNNEKLRIIEEFESITNVIKLIEVMQMTVKKYLDTGPYKTWEEVQVDLLRYLIQKPGLNLFANELSESLICFCTGVRPSRLTTSPHWRKRMIEACIHPAVTKLNANKIPIDILLELLPRLKDLNTLKVKARITGDKIYAKDAEIFACMSRCCTRLKCLCISFQLCRTLPATLMLDDVIASLPSTLTSVSFYGMKQLLDVKFLKKMVTSESLNTLKRLTLCEVNPNYPLHQGLRTLVAVTVLNSQFRRSKLLRNVGGWLKELSFSCVFNIEFRILAECCPSLETLLLKHCTFFMSFHTEPLPTFSSLKEIHFLRPNFVSQEYDICICCILQNSPVIEKLVVVLSEVKFETCFQKLMKTNEMKHLQEFQLYKCDNHIYQGLIKTDLAVQIINRIPTLSFIGGIEDAITQRKLSEMYTNKTFVCIHEKILEDDHQVQYILSQHALSDYTLSHWFHKDFL